MAWIYILMQSYKSGEKVTFVTNLFIFSYDKSRFARAFIPFFFLVTNLAASAFSFFITRMY